MGGMAIHAVSSGRRALACLLDPHAQYDHVLLNPARDDGLLLPILGLTCDEEASGSELLSLGRAAGQPSHVCVIPGPTPLAIWNGLALGCRNIALQPPSVGALRDALAERRIETRYQPLVRLSDGTLHGVEALARLHRVGQRLIGPDRFVRRIEDAGLAAELTQLVAMRSFADITSPALISHALPVALNVPLDVLLLRDAMDRLEAARQAAGLEAARLVIELTESRAVSDLPQLRRVVERLRQAGHRVAIDDISPAMPHHQALLDIPFSSVKFSKDLVMRSGAPGDAADFVTRNIAAAKARGLTVVVEGVCDTRTWNRVRNAGADLAQGFAIARPLPVSVLPAWIDAWHGMPV
jgi:EAL domain-containing protein (putative c-di-GMP-specific phosphodiesterase class I)